MIKKTVMILASATVAMSVYGQKLVIGSKLPDIRGVKWLSEAPKGGRNVVVDFYQSTNANCKANIAKLESLKTTNPTYTVVILTRDAEGDITDVVKSYGSKFSIGIDESGKVYESFGVKFVPFTMVFDNKSEMKWQGNIAQLPQNTL